jgi:hypothetical protein
MNVSEYRNAAWEKLTDKQHAAIAALLSTSTHAAAAEKAGISDTCLYGWLLQPAFKETYRYARREIIEGIIASLTAAGIQAVAVLKHNLDNDSPGVQVRAASAILTHLRRGLDSLDVSQALAGIKSLEEGLEQ